MRPLHRNLQLLWLLVYPVTRTVNRVNKFSIRRHLVWDRRRRRSSEITFFLGAVVNFTEATILTVQLCRHLAIVAKCARESKLYACLLFVSMFLRIFIFVFDIPLSIIGSSQRLTACCDSRSILYISPVIVRITWVIEKPVAQAFS